MNGRDVEGLLFASKNKCCTIKVTTYGSTIITIETKDGERDFTLKPAQTGMLAHWLNERVGTDTE